MNNSNKNLMDLILDKLENLKTFENEYNSFLKWSFLYESILETPDEKLTVELLKLTLHVIDDLSELIDSKITFIKEKSNEQNEIAYKQITNKFKSDYEKLDEYYFTNIFERPETNENYDKAYSMITGVNLRKYE